MRQCVIVIRESIIFQFRFPKQFGKILIVSMLRNKHLSICLKSQISVAKKSHHSTHNPSIITIN